MVSTEEANERVAAYQLGARVERELWEEGLVPWLLNLMKEPPKHTLTYVSSMMQIREFLVENGYMEDTDGES